MADEIKKYCEGLDCAICDEKEPCIYKIANELEEQLDQLKAKNEQLKKEIRLYDCIDKWGTEQCRCACRCLGNEFCDDADKKINKLKQALIDIRECLIKNAEKGWVSTSEIDDILQNVDIK